jgi:hypothetical protein
MCDVGSVIIARHNCEVLSDYVHLCGVQKVDNRTALSREQAFLTAEHAVYHSASSGNGSTGVC